MDNLWITNFDIGWGYVYTNNKDMQTIFITKLSKQGSSLGIIIPMSILRAYNWQRGDLLVFGFAGAEQLWLKKMTDKDMEMLKPDLVLEH